MPVKQQLLIFQAKRCPGKVKINRKSNLKDKNGYIKNRKQQQQQEQQQHQACHYQHIGMRIKETGVSISIV